MLMPSMRHVALIAAAAGEAAVGEAEAGAHHVRREGEEGLQTAGVEGQHFEQRAHPWYR